MELVTELNTNDAIFERNTRKIKIHHFHSVIERKLLRKLSGQANNIAALLG